MKRLLIIMASLALVFGDSPEGQWKLSGLRVDYFDIARQDGAVVVHDSYGFGISVPVASFPAGALFNVTVNGPFTNAVLGYAGINLNVNLYPNGTGAVGEGSYYPDVETGTLPDGTSDCITTGKIFPITDQFNWDAPADLDGAVPYPSTNIIGLPSANSHAGTAASGLGVNGSSVFDNWPADPVHIATPPVLPAIATADAVLAVGPAGACGTPAFDTDGDMVPDATLADVNFGGDLMACIGTVTAAGAGQIDGMSCADFGTCLPGEWGGMYKTGSFDSQMGQDLTTKFLLEWNAIDGWESESGLGDDLTVDEDGDGTDFDRIFGIPYVTSTVVDQSNPLCDITGGALTGAGAGLAYPVAGDIVAELGGESAVAALVTSECLTATAATVDGMCQFAGGPAEFVYGSCLAQVEDGVEAQCDAADLDGDGVGTPVEAVTGLCAEASQSVEFAGACAAYGASTALIATCMQLGFDEETCAAAGSQGIAGVEQYCDSQVDFDADGEVYGDNGCADIGVDQCDLLTNLEFATGICGGLAAALTTSTTCDEWAASFDDAFLNENATAVLGMTCSDYAFATTGLEVGSMYSAACGAFAEGAADEAFATSSGMTCTEYGNSYVGMCVIGTSAANDFYLMDTSLTPWGLFLTYNAASVQQYMAAGYTMEEVFAAFPEYAVNDAAYDFDPSCYYTDDTCGGRLVMQFAPTCVPEVEAHQIVAEFVDLEALVCDATGDVTGGYDDLACVGCECVDTNGDGAITPDEWCFSGEWEEEFEGPAGDGTVNIFDILKMIQHITDPLAQLGGYLFCAGDMNQDGVINVIDVIMVVGVIQANADTGDRLDDASSATIEYSSNKINITSDGYVGGIDILVEFANESFNFELGEHYVADSVISGNTARIIMVGKEHSIENVLEVTQGEIISVTNALVGNSSEEVTDVTITYDENQPLSYIIKDAYPNPFNPVTNISVELNTTADISVKVYNLTGQLVDVIVQGNFSPNTYNWTWNAENLASGVYFIATQIGNDINNQKVMLIK